jgi:hypothetical protein
MEILYGPKIDATERVDIRKMEESDKERILKSCGYIRSQWLRIEKRKMDNLNVNMICDGWIQHKKMQIENLMKREDENISEMLLEIDKKLEENERLIEALKLQFQRDIKEMDMLLFENKIKQFDLKSYLKEADEELFEKLKLKIEDCNKVSENLFKKEMKICLAKLKTQEPSEGKPDEKVGKEVRWKKLNRSEMMLIHEKNLGLKLDILTRRVRMKRNELQGMHRKTRWKGDEFVIVNQKFFEKIISMKNDMPMEKYPEDMKITIRMGAEVDLLKKCD